MVAVNVNASAGAALTLIPRFRADTIAQALETSRSPLFSGSDEAEFSAAALGRAEAASTDDDGPASDKNLSQEERQEVEKLKARDAEVRAHEQAHLSALGGEGGSASFQYTTGPDGRKYATGGEVPISIGRDPSGPEATIQKARTIARAAVAPAQPSSADQAARARAQQLEAEARQELREKRDRGDEEDDHDSDDVDELNAAAKDLVGDAAKLFKPEDGDEAEEIEEPEDASRGGEHQESDDDESEESQAS